MSSKMFDGMRVKLVKQISVWVADIHEIDRYLDEGHNYVGVDGLGHSFRVGSIGTIRHVVKYTTIEDNVPPNWIVKSERYDEPTRERLKKAWINKYGKHRFPEVVKYAGEKPPSNLFIAPATGKPYGISHWWALELDDYPLTPDRFAYFRGICLHSQGNDLPDYLESVAQ